MQQNLYKTGASRRVVAFLKTVFAPTKWLHRVIANPPPGYNEAWSMDHLLLGAMAVEGQSTFRIIKREKDTCLSISAAIENNRKLYEVRMGES